MEEKEIIMRHGRKCYLAGTFKTQNATCNVYKPIISDTERDKRMKKLNDAAFAVIIGAEKAKREEMEANKKSPQAI